MPYLDPAAGAARETYSSAGAPAAGTNEVQTLTLGGTPTGGSFALSYQGWVTALINWNATNATLIAAIKAALEALGNIGSGNLTVAAGTLTAGIGTVTITFSGGGLQKRNVPLLAVAANNLTGTSPTVAVAETTAGVNADGLGASKGATLVRLDTGARYQNTGTPTAPNWVAL